MIGVYVRVSTQDQNIRQQKDLLVKYIRENKPGSEYRTYKDEAMSGKIIDRPGWNKLILDCERGKIRHIFVSKYDRITRDLEYAIRFIRWLRQNKDVRLFSLYDGSFDPLVPDMVFNFKLKCLLSEYELEVLAWRRRIGIERAKLEGRYKGGKKGRTWKVKRNG